ncbi:MAG: class I SAM-dependent methyltransferase [Myxococcales bacterium]
MARAGGRPRDSQTWNEVYSESELPWDSGVVDVHLAGVLERHGIEPGKALEVGCGTGTNTLWLAQHGFKMTGMDIAQQAIAKAEAKVAAAGVKCRLLVGDFLADEVPGAPYRFVYDRGVFHVFETRAMRSRFASRVARLLRPKGVWHSIIGSTDGPPRQAGPPRVSAAEIVTAVEPHFEIRELSSTAFDPQSHRDVRAWILVARRRAA